MWEVFLPLNKLETTSSLIPSQFSHIHFDRDKYMILYGYDFCLFGHWDTLIFALFISSRNFGALITLDQIGFFFNLILLP